MIPTDGNPVVHGDWLHADPEKPTVLINGHFDVQPAEPFELWQTHPFRQKYATARSGVGVLRTTRGHVHPDFVN